MRGLPPAETGPTTRIRRWDAVMLGGALPGMLAAARLAMHGVRVLVLEEESAVRQPLLREPFWLGGADKHGVLASCLRELRVPLIDQRRFQPDPLAFQLVLPDARLDIGEPRLTLDEWVAWGLAKPEEARALVGGLLEAATHARDAMLRTPIVRPPRRLPLGARRTGSADAPSGGEPAPAPPAAPPAPPRLAKLLAASLRALSNLGESSPSGLARARLQGLPFEGSALLRGTGSLHALLRHRIESLYGEFRSLPPTFRLVSAGGQPGVAPDAEGESGEVWVGRALVLNASREALAGAVSQQPVPEVLGTAPASRRRLSLRLRVPREALPEAMASRVIILGDERLAPEGTNLVCVRRFAASAADAPVDLLATAVVPAAEAVDAEARRGEMQARVSALLPFAEGRLERVRAPEPRWDRDGWLADPVPETAWPAPLALRLAPRQPIYLLDRAAVGGLGCEGDLLLGWRGGDAIAPDLA